MTSPSDTDPSELDEPTENTVTLPGIRAVADKAQAYAPGEGRPLRGYLTLMSTYAGVVTAVGVVALLTGKQPPEEVRPWDVTLIGLATHKLTRIVAKDSITSPIRAPFTTYDGPAGPGEVNEEVREEGHVAHAIGELLTCPFCLGVWSSTAFAAGMYFAPRVTRVAASVFATVAIADFLQFGYAAAEKAAEG